MSPYTMPSAPILSAAKLPRGACDRALPCFAGISATAVCRFAPFETHQADKNYLAHAGLRLDIPQGLIGLRSIGNLRPDRHINKSSGI